MQIANSRSDTARATLVKYHANRDDTSHLVIFGMCEVNDNTERARNQPSSIIRRLCASFCKQTEISDTAVIGFYSAWIGNAVVSYYLALILKHIGITATAEQAL
jgi:hypothetical protein